MRCSNLLFWALADARATVLTLTLSFSLISNDPAFVSACRNSWPASTGVALNAYAVLTLISASASCPVILLQLPPAARRFSVRQLFAGLRLARRVRTAISLNTDVLQLAAALAGAAIFLARTSLRKAISVTLHANNA